LQDQLEGWSLGPQARALTALRGVDWLAGMTLLAELGELTRFDSPRELMGFVGLTSSEHSSGPRRRQGAITKAGNEEARRLLVECAWAYRFPARRSRLIQRRAEKASPAVQAIAWKAQLRLCARFRKLRDNGKHSNVVVTAVARELLGFIWAIVVEQTRTQQEKRVSKAA
jgi:transposase